MVERPQYDIPLPARLRGLPRNHQGFIVPYFVAWFDAAGKEVEPGQGTPEFRVINPARMNKCIRDRRCWCCGEKLGRFLCFAIGPMCAVSRTTMEPPSHYECAAYSVKVCPFLSRPKMVRNEKNMPEGHWAPGVTIARNPGVTALWVCRDYERFRVDSAGGGNPGSLIHVGEPDRVEWWARGRPATRAEVQASIDSGLPALMEMVGPDSRRELEQVYMPKLNALLPVEDVT